MSFIRPELLSHAQRFLSRWFSSWIEAFAVITTGALGFFGLIDGVASGEWLNIAGGAFLLFIAIGALVAFRRNARLSGDGQGAGVVQVAEGRIAYLAPKNGGFADRDRLTRVEILIVDNYLAVAFWVLWQEDQPPLIIHSGAKGISALIDTIASLQGANMEMAVTALGLTEPSRTLIWSRDGDATGTESTAAPRLHSPD